MKRRGVEVRGRTLDAAQRLFAEEGFAAAATGRVGEEAGVPGGLTFFHPETEQGLVQTQVWGRTFLPESRANIGASAATEPHPTLFDVGIRSSQALQRGEQMVRILMGEVLANEAVSGSLHQLTREGSWQIAAHPDVAAGDGRLRPFDTEHPARTFVAGTVFTERPGDPERSVAGIVDRLPDRPTSRSDTKGAP